MTNATRTKSIILLVDDNADILTVTSAYLRSRGFEVVAAHTPFGVTALIRKHNPAAIVLDVMMPALDGDNLARFLRSQGLVTDTPIIFHSSMAEEALHKLSRDLPGTSYVLKSDGLGVLYDTLRERLGRP